MAWDDLTPRMKERLVGVGLIAVAIEWILTILVWLVFDVKFAMAGLWVFGIAAILTILGLGVILVCDIKMKGDK